MIAMFRPHFESISVALLYDAADLVVGPDADKYF